MNISDCEEGQLSLSDDVLKDDKNNDMGKISNGKQVKRLRARKTLKGSFWLSNRLYLFRAQKRCGNLRMKISIFGVYYVSTW